MFTEGMVNVITSRSIDDLRYEHLAHSVTTRRYELVRHHCYCYEYTRISHTVLMKHMINNSLLLYGAIDNRYQKSVCFNFKIRTSTAYRNRSCCDVIVVATPQSSSAVGLATEVSITHGKSK